MEKDTSLEEIEAEEAALLEAERQRVAEAQAAYDYESLPDVAKRALAEAQKRRDEATAADAQKELGGRDGPEPVRYGDWEKKGIAIDF